MRVLERVDEKVSIRVCVCEWMSEFVSSQRVSK